VRFDFKIHWGLSVIYYAGSIYVMRYGHLSGALSGFLIGTVFFVLAVMGYYRKPPR